MGSFRKEVRKSCYVQVFKAVRRLVKNKIKFHFILFKKPNGDDLPKR
jgi:hypothetical protein